MLPRQYYSEQDIRKRQIDTLKIFNDHVTEVNENSEYRVEFVADGKNMSLLVILGPDFPNEKPSIFVNPPIPHPWIGENSNKVVGAPGLVNYTLHSDLGRVVQAIIREFQKSMPKFSNSDDVSRSNDVSPQSNYSGQMPVETFIAKFAEKRGLGQARRAREERIAHQLAQLDRATTKS
ncbi:unnamed protein product [Spodoptera littoralis]|uniref:Uncharacterized protein n=1 Tax=Spodoptera littoralis TaxID=7109 RepID=A0A9P0N747_SPOLI|nr:unnamed protein product [Spodoptera littoralis]CAH1642245.1 unnamed protein product [Spodoptera littoralis]